MCTLTYHTDIETLQSEGLPIDCSKATVDPANTPSLPAAAAAIILAAMVLAATPAAVKPTVPKTTGVRAMAPRGMRGQTTLFAP